MDIKNLKTFLYTAELNSFTKAAQKLDYSQSTVSFQIKQLEQELGVSLFERINHTVALTDKGSEILRYAHQINQTLEEMQKISQPETEIKGHIRLAMADSLCTAIVQNLFQNLRKNHPGITMKIIPAGTDEMFRLLNQNEVDFVYTLDNHIYHRDYIIVKESKQKIHFVTNRANPLLQRTPLTLADLSDQPFILTEKGMSYRRILDERLASLSLEIQPVFEVGNTELICRMLEDNISTLSFLPDYATRQFIQEGRLCFVEVNDFDVEIWAQLLYHRDKWISPQMQAFIDFMQSQHTMNPM